MNNFEGYKKSMTYNDWHRNALPSWCYCTDVDFLEVRYVNGEMKIVAIIETKSGFSRLSDFQESVFEQLSKQSGIPWFLVRHNEAMTDFEVNGKQMNEGEYIAWIKSL